MSQTSFIGIETIDVMIRYNIKHQPLSGRHANRYPIIRGPLLIAKEKVRNLMLVSIKTLIQVWNILQDPVRNQVWLQIHKCSDLRSQTSACYKAYIRCFKPQNPKLEVELEPEPDTIFYRDTNRNQIFRFLFPTDPYPLDRFCAGSGSIIKKQ